MSLCLCALCPPALPTALTDWIHQDVAYAVASYCSNNKKILNTVKARLKQLVFVTT